MLVAANSIKVPVLLAAWLHQHEHLATPQINVMGRGQEGGSHQGRTAVRKGDETQTQVVEALAWAQCGVNA